MFQPFGPEAEGSLREHARQVFPQESCGFILKDGSYVALANISETPEDMFQISAADYIKYADELACVVHSHPAPNAPNYPSELDMSIQRRTAVPWCIVTVNADGKDREVFYWGDLENPEPLIGRKFKHGVTDCWALVRDWYWICCGIRLPMGVRKSEWWETAEGEENLFIQNYERANLELVDIDFKELQIGDIVVGRLAGSVTPNHCGVYIGNSQILHHWAARLSKRDLINTLWKFRVWVFRYKGELNVKTIP